MWMHTSLFPYSFPLLCLTFFFFSCFLTVLHIIRPSPMPFVFPSRVLGWLSSSRTSLRMTLDEEWDLFRSVRGAFKKGAKKSSP